MVRNQGRRQVQQSGVDNMGWGRLCPLPRNFLKWRVLVHFERADVEIALINSLQFLCVYTVTNRFYYRNCLTPYIHLKFLSQVYHSTPPFQYHSH